MRRRICPPVRNLTSSVSRAANGRRSASSAKSQRDTGYSSNRSRDSSLPGISLRSSRGTMTLNSITLGSARRSLQSSRQRFLKKAGSGEHGGGKKKKIKKKNNPT